MRTEDDCPYCAARRRNALVLAWLCVRGHYGPKDNA